MAEFKFNVEKIVGAIEKGIELRVVAWGNYPAKYDLRKWYTDSTGAERCAKGFTFNAEEGKALSNSLRVILSGDQPEGISQGRNTIRCQLTRYGYDIAVWNNNYRLKGITLSEDGVKTLYNLMSGEFDSDKTETKVEAKKETTQKVSAKVVKVAAPKATKSTDSAVTKQEADKVVKALTSIPVNDGNYPIKDATADQLREAISIMENDANGHHKTRLSRCKAKLKQLEKSGSKIVKVTKKAEDTVDNTEGTEEVYTKNPDEKAGIIIFPKKDTTEIKKLQPTGEHHTYAEAEAKLNKEREMFKGDRDSNYVIDGILEACVSDQEFLDNVMRPEKSYIGAFQYFANKAREGYCMRVGNACVMDADTALKYAIDYFNSEDSKEKKEVAETKKEAPIKTPTRRAIRKPSKKSTRKYTRKAR